MPNGLILKIADQHVRDAEKHIARQKEIISELRRDGHPTLLAESLLQAYELTLESHLDHVARLRSDSN